MPKKMIPLLLLSSLTMLVSACVKTPAPTEIVENIIIEEQIVSQEFWQNPSLEILSSLIAEGENVNAIDKDGFSPLMLCLIKNHVNSIEIATALLEAGADVNAKNSAGMSPLMLTIVQNPSNVLDIVTLLIRSGAKVNAKDNIGLTPLMLSVPFSNHTRMINLLVRNGAKVNEVDNIGMTALMHTAQSSSNVNIAKTLLAYGADINQVDNSGMTALAYLMRDNETAGAHALLTHFIELEDIDLTTRDKDGILAFNHALFNNAIFNSRPYWTLKDVLMGEGITDLNFIQRL